jgi:hypothetical protein
LTSHRAELLTQLPKPLRRRQQRIDNLLIDRETRSSDKSSQQYAESVLAGLHHMQRALETVHFEAEDTTAVDKADQKMPRSG